LNLFQITAFLNVSIHIKNTILMNGNLLSLLFVVMCFASMITSCGNPATTAETTAETATIVKEEKKIKKAGYNVGDIVKDFSLENIDNKMVSLASLGEDVKGATVVFTCNTCPYAVMYEDRLVELSKKAKEAGYPIIAIMPNDLSVKPDDSLAKMKERSAEKSFDFPYVIDAKQEIFPQFGATKTPEVYVLDKTEEGFKVAYHGAIDDNHEDAAAVQVNYVNKAFDALEKGEAVDPGSTKAIGCSIKVKKD
jgi:peroxiredoxin